MKISELNKITKIITGELRLFPDPVRLLAPKLLNYTKNYRDFLILFELSKFQSNRSQILKIIQNNQFISEKLSELIKRKFNKKINNKINNMLEKIHNNEEINL